MDNNNKMNFGGTWFYEVLFIVFLVLKLCKIGDVANWSWWWVTAPLWGGAIIGILSLLIVLIIYWVADK